MRKAKKAKELQKIFVKLVCENSPEGSENKALLPVRDWRSVRVVRLDRDSAGRQTSANAGRATDFTRKCITRDGGLSILKCDG